MTPEDIGDIFQALEDALFDMAIRTMKHHQNWEEEEGFKWTQWQAEQINGLWAYRQNVSALTNYHFNLAKKAIEAFLREAYEGSVSDAAGLIARYGIGGIHPGFFGVNSKKLDVLINEAIQNIDTKRYAAINRMNSGYTDMLRKADMFAQSGSFTIPQVIDMAAKNFLSAGLNCVEYSNGNRVNIASYAEMALRTSSSEVTRQANGDVRNELGEYLVVSNVIAMTCPICQKWQGKVMIDDVYSNGKPDGKHKLVSESKADGFMHPNCRHQLFMYIEGVTKIADLPNDVQTRERYDAEQKQRYYERQIRKYKRLRDAAMDPENKNKYAARVKEWTAKHDQFLREHDYLRKNPKRLAPGYTGNGKPEVQINSEYIVNNTLTKENSPIAPQPDSSNTQTNTMADKTFEVGTTDNNVTINDSQDVPADTSVETEDKSPNYEDIADTWHDHIPEGRAEVIERKVPVNKDGVEYSDVELLRDDNKPEEHKIADILSKVIHSEIEVIPEVDLPKGYPTPDFLIRRTGETMELKTLKKTPPSENAIYNAAKKAREQSSFVIIDISIYTHEDCIEQQVKNIFRYDGTAFVERLMLIRNGEIVGIYKRV